MKKVKLLTSLSSLAIVVPTIPVVSTSCSEEFNFNGVYTQEQVLGDGLENWYTENNTWLQDYLKFAHQDWSDEEFQAFNYNSDDASTYINKNIRSVKQLVGCLIYSYMLCNAPTVSSENPLKIKISDSNFAYTHSTNTFTLSFTLSTFDYVKNKYIDNFKIRTRDGNALRILRASKYNSDLNTITIGKSYIYSEDDKVCNIDFGLEVSICTDDNYIEWQNLSSTSLQTAGYIDGIVKWYIPAWLSPNVQFRDGFSYAMIYDCNDYITGPVYRYTFDQIYFDRDKCKGDTIFIYFVFLYVNEVFVLLNSVNDSNLRITVTREDSTTNGDWILFSAAGPMIALLPTAPEEGEWKDEAFYVNITYSTLDNISGRFIAVADDNSPKMIKSTK